MAAQVPAEVGGITTTNSTTPSDLWTDIRTFPRALNLPASVAAIAVGPGVSNMELLPGARIHVRKLSVEAGATLALDPSAPLPEGASPVRQYHVAGAGGAIDRVGAIPADVLERVADFNRHQRRVRFHATLPVVAKDVVVRSGAVLYVKGDFRNACFADVRLAAGARLFVSSEPSATVRDGDRAGGARTAGADLDDLEQDRAWAKAAKRAEATRDAHVCSTQEWECVRSAVLALDDKASTKDTNVGGFEGYMGGGAAAMLGSMYEKVVVAKPDDPVAFLLEELTAE